MQTVNLKLRILSLCHRFIGPDWRLKYRQLATLGLYRYPKYPGINHANLQIDMSPSSLIDPINDTRHERLKRW